MGVDCKIYLGLDVNDMALADAIGVLAGLPAKFVDNGKFKSCDVEGAASKPTHTPMMGEIVLDAPKGTSLADGETNHTVYFHFGHRFRKQLWLHLSPPSTPFWIAVGKRLVDWYGGFLIYSDCSDDKAPGNLYKHKRTCPVDLDGFVPNDGDSWNKYQEATANLKPVSAVELRDAWKHASYQSEFDRSGKRPEHVKV